MEPKKEYDYLIKLVVVGERGSGLSSVIVRMGRDEFNPGYHSTIGVDFVLKTISVDGKKVKVQIWDTSGGRERFRTISSAYYRGSMGLIVVYDITNENSFKYLADHQIPELEKHAPPNSVKMILGTKCDLSESRAVSTERGKELADKHGYKFLEVSAKTGQNMEQALLEIAKDVKTGIDSNLIETHQPRKNVVLEQEAKKTAYRQCF